MLKTIIVATLVIDLIPINVNSIVNKVGGNIKIGIAKIEIKMAKSKNLIKPFLINFKSKNVLQLFLAKF